MRRVPYTTCAAGLAVVLTASTSWSAVPVGTAFTYQGQIKDAGVPANGAYDFVFRLFDAPSGPAQLDRDVLVSNWPVSNGLVTVQLDFGASVFLGDARWLEVAVRPGSSIGPYTTLSPRQPLTAVPYALYAIGGPGGTEEHWVADGVDVYNTNAGNIGIHELEPLALLHVLGSDQSLGDTAVYGEDLILEDADAVLGLFSSPAGNYGSAFGLSETDGGALVDKWTLYRTTSGAFPGSQLRFSFGSSANYSSNPTRLALSADGSVGIGTTAPASPLHLAGTAQIMQKIVTSNTAGTWLDLENTSTGGKRWGILTTGSGNGEGAGHLILRATTDGHSVMTLKGTGEVGIGTTAPQARLHLDGGTETTPSDGGYLVVGRTNSTNLSFDDNEIQARILGIAAPLLVNPAGGSIHLIQSGSGRVGIGTGSPNPDVKLDVVAASGYTAIQGSNGEVGIAGWGGNAGGYFKDSNATGEIWLGTVDAGYVPHKDCGLLAQAAELGGLFNNTIHGTWLRASLLTSSTVGNGSKLFVQNHPYEKDKIIAYTCLEGDETGTYTRGSGRLLNGEARIALGETFKWVTNPDIGLTAHLTPRDQAVPLAVVSLTPEELVVRGPQGGPTDVAFDYIVYGLRIGFEESTVVLAKNMEAYIPSMASLEDAYATNPGLRRFNALERFKAMRTADGETASLDLSRAKALRDAITVYDPAIHQMPHPPRPAEQAGARHLEKPVAAEPFENRQQASAVHSSGEGESERQELRARVEALENLVSQLTGAQDDGQAGQ